MPDDADKTQPARQGTIDDGSSNETLVKRMFRRIMFLWYVHPDATFIVYASPMHCLHLLATAAKPSIDRLHLRNLFAHGRRYHFLRGSREGFRIVTTSKIPWSRRGRTRPNAMLDGTFQELDENLTQINITAQVHVFNIGWALIVPLFLTPMFLVAPWHPVLRFTALFLIYALAWIAYRYNAAIDAHDMVYFIEKALEDYLPKSVSELGSVVPHVVDLQDEDFPAEWERFYQAHQEGTDSA